MTQQNDLQERLLAFMKEEDYKPLTVSEIEEAFELAVADDFRELVKTLVKMEALGYWFVV